MNVWVEPAVWYGEGERPIKQLEVKAESYLSELPVKGYRAVSVVDEPCPCLAQFACANY